VGCVDDGMGVRGFPVGYVKKGVFRNSLQSKEEEELMKIVYP